MYICSIPFVKKCRPQHRIVDYHFHFLKEILFSYLELCHDKCPLMRLDLSRVSHRSSPAWTHKVYHFFPSDGSESDTITTRYLPGTRPVPELFYPDPPGPDPPGTRSARYQENHYPDLPGTRVFDSRPITILSPDFSHKTSSGAKNMPA